MSGAKLWHISGFTEGPHWDAAIVRADTADGAKVKLGARLAATRHNDDTLWDLVAPEKWQVTADGHADDVIFVLGSGCR